MRQFSSSLQISGFLLSLSFVSSSAYGHCGGHCEGVAHAAPSVTIGQDGAASTTYSAASGLYQVDSRGMPILNSSAGSMGSLYIDFDGGTWYGYNGAYDTDGDTTTYSAYEQDDIYKAWRDVSTHFAMFDINVTTIEPDRLVTPTASVLVSNDAFGGGANYGGLGGTVATGATAAHFARVRSTGITHELGHILVLGHQSVADANGNLVSVYRGADQWNVSPLMGADGASKFSSWQQGVRPDGGSTTAPQDDMAGIVSTITTVYDSFSGGTYAGDGYRADDHGNSRSAATVLPSGGGAVAYNVKTSGILERHGDKDFFEIQWDGGDMSIHIEAERSLASGSEYASSARTVARLIRPSGNWIASRWPSDPVDMTEVINKSNLAAGTYWIRIDSPGGYSDLGAYNIWIDNGIAGAAPLQFAAVPEPSSLALLGIGGLMLARRRRR